MRIAWFTPLSQKSAIARFSAAATASLSKMADLDLCYFDAEDIREPTVPTRHFQSAASVPTETLNTYDVVVYNFGNYLPFHREIYLLSRRWPGVCILHDLVMHHFFAAYCFDYLRDAAAYQLLLENSYGVSAPASGRVWETEEVVRFPLFEEAIRGALGVITHSNFFKDRVEACFAGPVTRISLAYDKGPTRSAVSRKQLGLTPDQILLVTVGHVNPNKQIESVIDALAQIGFDSRSIVYAVLGPASPDYERKLKTQAEEKGLGSVVRFLGEVSDEILGAYLSAADVCVNLRFPAMEGASASVIEEMLFGKPVIFTDTGFFSELPDECVIKVPPGSATELASALRYLAKDSSARELAGARAKAFAEAEFHADRYAKRVMEFIGEIQGAKPLISLVDRVGVELGRMGVRADTPILDVVAREIQDTFVSEHPALHGRRRP
jgi:glycosyltransferase involved in cell wall biosynthesis